MKGIFMKKILLTFLSIAIIVGVIHCSDIVLKDITDHGVVQCTALYDQPRETIDVLVLGSSHVHYGVNNAKLWEDYGIASYDLSSAEQSIWVSYHYLVEACKKQKPKVVVLDFFSPAGFLEDHKFRYTFLADSLNGMKFSLNKAQLMTACFEGKIELWNKHFPAFFGYHDRYKVIESEDFKKLTKDYSTFKGYIPHFQMEPQGQIPELSTEIKEPESKSIEYLDKIVEYTSKNDIELYITTVPYILNVQQTEDAVQEEDKIYNWLEQYVEQIREQGYDNVCFDYIFKHYYDLGLNGETDYFDGSHLNYYGSCKFTDYLGQQLRSRYSLEKIPDRRGDERFLSWDENVESIRQEVENNGYEY